MKPKLNKLLTLLMALIMTMAFSVFVNADIELAEDYTGKTVILSSNDVHGAVDGYAYMKALEKVFTDRGADVITVDAGDYSQGTTYVSLSKGRSAIQMMNQAGYDYATLGNHEFDYGLDALKANISEAKFKILCADIFNKDDGTSAYTPSDIYVDEESGLKIGFFGMATPESQTKANPKNFADYEFPSEDEIYPLAQGVVDQLKADGVDLVVCLAHLGVDSESDPYRSTDFISAVEGIDIVLDGHSHSVMEKGDDNQPIMSTGTKFMNVGVTVIDEESKKIETNGLYHFRDKEEDPFPEDLTPDADVKAASDALKAQVDEEYGLKIAESKVNLNGERGTVNGVYGNRNGETNLGDLITDAIKWYIVKDGVDLGVPEKNIVTITNGGGIRAPIEVGDVTLNTIHTVLPFGNTVAAVTVTGGELLEALEASTYCSPDSTVGGFPQIEGMNISINKYADYDANAETYPGSTYYGPASIKRVTIDKVNGEAFDPDATYVVLTNDFCSAGGDTYYAFKAASSQFDTGITMDYAVSEYIIEHLDGVIDESYAEPKGRITYYGKADPSKVEELIGDLPAEVGLDDAAAIQKARNYYESLTDEEKASLPETLELKLEAGEAKLTAAEAQAKAEEAQAKAEEAQAKAEAAETNAAEAQAKADAAEAKAEEAAAAAAAAEVKAAEAQAKADAAEARAEAAETNTAEAQAKVEAAEAKANLAAAVVDASTSGITADKFTKATYSDYAKAFADAKAALKNADATADQLKAAEKTLSDAQAALKEKANQTLNVSKKAKTLKAKSLKKAKKVVSLVKASGAKTTLSFSKVSGKKYFKVDSKTGKITVKKGTKKGTYTVKVKVTAPANDNYKAATKTVSVKIKVK